MVTVSITEARVSVQVEDTGTPLNPPETHVFNLDTATKLDGLGVTLKKLLAIPNEYDIEALMSTENPQLVVDAGEPSYDPRSGLRINHTQNLVDYFKAYRAYHGLRNSDSNTSESKLLNSIHGFGGRSSQTIQIGPAHLTFHRTLRVPDNNTNSALPPSLGTFPLEPAENHTERLSSAMKARGGVLLPIMQREAMWIGFNGAEQCAVKISIGGINALTGHPSNKTPPSSDKQDYMSIPGQPWLDGICTEPGSVRQFVAMPLGKGYTVEEQMTGQAQIGGLQVDVFPSFNLAVKFRKQPEDHGGITNLDLTKSPQELGISTSEVINMIIDAHPCTTPQEYISRIHINPLIKARCGLAPIRVALTLPTGQTQSVPVSHLTTIKDLVQSVPEIYRSRDLEVKFKGEDIALSAGEDKVGMDVHDLTLGACKIPTGAQIDLRYPPRFGGNRERDLQVGSGGPRRKSAKMAKSSSAMGLAAGGKIEQKIYVDSNPVNIYDEERAVRLWVHTLSSEGWEEITGVVPPISPITPETYKSHNYPWFSLYDEHKDALPSTGAFNKIQSVKMLDNSSAKELTPSGVNLLDPSAPPPCTGHRQSTSACVLRPCSHTACEQCIDKASASAKCPNCDEMVDVFVGFKQPIKIQPGGGSTGNWKYAENQIDAPAPTNASVITLILEEDRVDSLYKGVVKRTRN